MGSFSYANTISAASWNAVVADVAGLLLVILNGTRLLACDLEWYLSSMPSSTSPLSSSSGVQLPSAPSVELRTFAPQGPMGNQDSGDGRLPLLGQAGSAYGSTMV